MNRSLDNRIEKLEADRGAGRTHCIWMQGTSDETDAEIEKLKVAGTIGEFDKVLVFRWKGPDE